MSIVVRPGAPFLAHFGQAGPPFLTIQTTGPRTRPATRISDGRFSEAPLRDATQADQEHEGLAQFYNCSYEHTLLIRSSYDCGAPASIRSPRSSGCGPKCRSTCMEERIDRADQLQRTDINQDASEA